MANQAPPASKAAAENNLYTVLLIIATALLFVGAIYLGARSFQLFEALWPPAGG